MVHKITNKKTGKIIWFCGNYFKAVDHARFIADRTVFTIDDFEVTEV